VRDERMLGDDKIAERGGGGHAPQSTNFGAMTEYRGMARRGVRCTPARRLNTL